MRHVLLCLGKRLAPFRKSKSAAKIIKVLLLHQLPTITILFSPNLPPTAACLYRPPRFDQIRKRVLVLYASSYSTHEHKVTNPTISHNNTSHPCRQARQVLRLTLACQDLVPFPLLVSVLGMEPNTGPRSLKRKADEALDTDADVGGRPGSIPSDQTSGEAPFLPLLMSAPPIKL